LKSSEDNIIDFCGGEAVMVSVERTFTVGGIAMETL
jgi:hypothetical protein